MSERTAGGILGHAPRIHLRATEEIIENSMARNSNHCVVAEALKEQYPHLTHISVDISTIRATDKAKKERYVWLTPRSVQQMIVDFDRGIKPKPFAFFCRDGQVTESGKGYHKRKHKKSKLRQPRGAAGHGRTVPERVGGARPPMAIGQRRSFGLRALKY